MVTSSGTDRNRQEKLTHLVKRPDKAQPSKTENFLKDFIYLFIERVEWRDKERERNISLREKRWLFLVCTPTRD